MNWASLLIGVCLVGGFGIVGATMVAAVLGVFGEAPFMPQPARPRISLAGSEEFDEFFRGDQWTPEELVAIERLGAKPLAFNVIQLDDYRPECRSAA